MSNKEILSVSEGEILDIEIEEDLLKANRELASANRKILDSCNVKSINVMGSIGSGKTSIIQWLIKELKNKYRIAVIAGDVTTDIDAERVREAGAKSIQINTGRGCHLDALMIRKAVKKLDLKQIDLLFIENVGNLICPADFPLGTHINMVVVSVTEGPYMIIKHPFIVKEANVVVINKIDLADQMEVEIDKLVGDAKKINPLTKTVATSVKENMGLKSLINALEL